MLATLLQVPTRLIERWEAGTLPPTYTLLRLSESFGVPVGALVDQDPPDRPLVDDRLLAHFRRFQRLAAKDRQALDRLLDTLASTLEWYRGTERPDA